jgi:TonB family protein
MVVLPVAVVLWSQSPLAQGGSPPPAPAPQTSPPAPAQPPLVVGRERVVAPRAIARVTPRYTAEAIRARLEGAVTLRGIVELDGTISSIEVVSSLDQRFGLDQAAVEALRQWRFEPATVDGKPVRTLITVSLNFTLRREPPVQVWPDGFSAAAAVAGGSEEHAETSGLRLSVVRPVSWIVRRDGPAGEWLGLRNADSTQWVGIFKPEAASFDVRWPTPETLLTSIAESVRRAQPVSDAETLATGQVQGTQAFWAWSTVRLPSVPNPPGITAATNPFREAHVWMFTQTPFGRVIGVRCTLLVRRELEGPAIDARVRSAAAEFAPIVNSVRIERVE